MVEIYIYYDICFRKELNMTYEEYKEYCKNFLFVLNKVYLLNCGLCLVKEIKKDSIIFLIKDTELKEISIALAKRIHFNKLFEILDTLPQIRQQKVCEDEPLYNKEKFSDEDFFWTLGTLTNSTFRAEIGSDFKKEFQEKFCCSDEEIESNSNIYYDCMRPSNNWRRLILDKRIFENVKFCLPCQGHIANSTKSKSQFHLNNSRIVDYLILHHNFSFGKKHNIEKIKETINEKFLSFFNEGINFINSLKRKINV